MYCDFRRNLIGINELMLAMKRLQKLPDDTRLQKIVQVLDEDMDGNIDIDDALKVTALSFLRELAGDK